DARNLGKIRAATPLTALDEISGDADIVGRGRPAELDLAAGGRSGTQARGGARRLRVDRCGARRRRTGIGTEIARGMRRAHAIAVARAGSEPGIAVARAGGAGDLSKARATGSLAA